MNDTINIELQKLQQELSLLDSAVKQINKAAEISGNVVASGKIVQEKYSEQLAKILQLYSEYLNKSYRHTEDNVKKLVEFFQEKVKDEERVLEKYTELSIKTEDLTHEYIKKAIDNNQLTLNEIVKENRSKVDEQQKNLQKFYDEIEVRLTEVLNSHKDKVNKIDELLSGYLELAQSTAALSTELHNVDFPKRLDEIQNSEKINNLNIEKINVLVSDIRKNQSDNNIKLEKLIKEETNLLLLAKVKRLESKISRTNAMIWILLLLNLGIIAAFLYAFKDLIM